MSAQILAIAYARFSSSNQHEESIIAQLRAIREYAEKNGVVIIKEYIDEARSATTDDRPEFLKMIKDISSGRVRVDYAYVHKLDRFARNRYDSAIYRRKLTLAGVRLVSVTQPLNDSPESIILEAMLEAMGEYYSKNLSNEVKGKMKEHARKGKHMGGTPPLGYDVNPETQKYIINVKEAEAVRLIFRMVLDGHGYSHILDTLNLRGYTTKRGNRFGKNSLYSILRNEKYAGTFIFNRTRSKVAGKRNNHANKAEEDIIRVPGAIPAIIEADDWRAVQKLMNKRKQVSPRHRSNTLYILTGLAECGLCGSAYTGKSQTGGRNKTKYRLYSCSAKKQKRTCRNKDVRKEVLENIVLDKIAQAFNPKTIDDLSVKLEKRYEELNTDKNTETKRIKRKLVDITDRIDRLFEALETGNMSSSVAGPRLNELTKEKEVLIQHLNEIENDLLLPFSKEQISLFLKNNQNLLKERTDMLACKKIVDNFIEKIIIYPDSIEVIMKFDLSDALNNGGGGPRLTLSASISKETMFSSGY